MTVFRKRTGKTARINTYSYYKGSNKPDINKKNRKEVTGKTKRMVGSITRRLSYFRISVVLACLALGLYLMSASTSPIIRFSIIGVNARETSIYKSEIQKVLERSIFNRSKLLFDYRGVENSIIEEFPEIESVQISFDLIGRRPVIKLVTLRPAYIFQSNGLSWVIDKRGVAIGLQSELRESFTDSLKNITDEVGSSNAINIGEALMSPGQVDFISSVIELLEKQLVVVTNVYLTDSPKELDIQLATDSWLYKLNIDEDPSGQAGTVIAVRTTLKADGDTPQEYVDLRAGEKVYWK